MATISKPRNRVGAGGLVAKPTATVSALWLLVALEIGAIAGLRRYYRKHHGG